MPRPASRSIPGQRPRRSPVKKARTIVVGLALLAGLAFGSQALADPEEGGQNPSGVCKGTNENRPPTCPPKND